MNQNECFHELHKSQEKKTIKLNDKSQFQLLDIYLPQVNRKKYKIIYDQAKLPNKKVFYNPTPKIKKSYLQKPLFQYSKLDNSKEEMRVTMLKAIYDKQKLPYVYLKFQNNNKSKQNTLYNHQNASLINNSLEDFNFQNVKQQKNKITNLIKKQINYNHRKYFVQIYAKNDMCVFNIQINHDPNSYKFELPLKEGIFLKLAINMIEIVFQNDLIQFVSKVQYRNNNTMYLNTGFQQIFFKQYKNHQNYFDDDDTSSTQSEFDMKREQAIFATKKFKNYEKNSTREYFPI